MSSALELAQGDPRLIAAIRRSRRLLGRKAILAAIAGAVPLPGIDWAADAALLARVVPQISAEFGLSAMQVDRMAPQDRERIRKAAATVGALLVGRLVTRELLIKLARHAGVRLTAQQAAKFVPVAGQVVSATMSYAALRALGELHIKDCVRVMHAVQHALPPPDSVVPIRSAAAERKPRSGVARAWSRLRLR
ncbi:MAG TPA: hypothetical protein VGI11_00055 [Variovorax sp.]|jgi:uncharacterized protein (DUF697 family)